MMKYKRVKEACVWSDSAMSVFIPIFIKRTLFITVGEVEQRDPVILQIDEQHVQLCDQWFLLTSMAV